MRIPNPPHTALARLAVILLATLLAWLCPISRSRAADTPNPDTHRSPIALALSADGTRLLTANATSNSVSLIDPIKARVVAERTTGDKPAGVAISRDGQRGVVAHWYGYDLAVLEIGSDSIKVVGRVDVGPEPRGVAMSSDGSMAYVAVGVSNEVVRVDLNRKAVTGRLEVGREPRNLVLSPDGATLLVGNARSKSVSLIAVGPWSVVRTIPIDGDNLRQVSISPDGKYGYIANMRNVGFATTRNNIDLGWVLGQRLTRVPLIGDESEVFATLSLDQQGRAASDAHGTAVSPDGRYIAVSSGGTHEVMIFRTDLRTLPWRPNGSRDLIHPELLRNDGRFRRVETGGRPTELIFAPDSKSLYVSNYLSDSVQVIDNDSAALVRTIALGGPEALSLARRGEILFHDAGRSHNQWYSCNTCHSDGHTNGLDFDTLNDGRQDLSSTHQRSRKKVPTLRHVTQTAPWTWHGWQKSLDDAMSESFTKSMQGKRPTPEEVKAVVAYLDTLTFPRNPFTLPDGKLSEAAMRGRTVFRSAKAACDKCHGGAEFTDGRIHIVGLEERDDAYRGYNPPSLKGVYDKDPYLHDGRAKTLRDVLSGPHEPDSVTGLGELSSGEVDDLLVYLKSL